MNEIARSGPVGSRTTQAAEGLPRWRWTTAELARLAELGAFRREDRLELIGGEIVPMSPTGRRHEVVSEAIERALRAQETPDVAVVAERQFNLSEDTYTEPDVIIRPAAIRTYDLKGPDAILVVEVAASSLAYDVKTKARLYAAFGVREYWVVDANSLSTIVFSELAADGYRSRTEVAADRELRPRLAPNISITLSTLDLA